MRDEAGAGWWPRRHPLEIVEEVAIRHLLEKDVIVVAAGGGGIPVVRMEDGCLEGVGAVIDKDRTSSLLAKNLGAEILMISTAVDKVAINFRPTRSAGHRPDDGRRRENVSGGGSVRTREA